MNTQRFSWIDNAKAFAIIAVIWMHVGKIIPAEFDFLPQGFIVPFNMHLFVFLSGLCAYNSMTRIETWSGVWLHIKKMCFRIGIPNICFFVLNKAVWSWCPSSNGELFNPIKNSFLGKYKII